MIRESGLMISELELELKRYVSEEQKGNKQTVTQSFKKLSTNIRK